MISALTGAPISTNQPRVFSLPGTVGEYGPSPDAVLRNRRSSNSAATSNNAGEPGSAPSASRCVPVGFSTQALTPSTQVGFAEVPGSQPSPARFAITMASAATPTTQVISSI